MIEIISDLEAGLKAQLASLANNIRSAEAALISTKEGYLKVQGALEIIDIIKKQLDTDDDKEAIDVALDKCWVT
jgi:hypothetical protein